MARFQQRCSCRLAQDYYSDNEEMLAKLAAGAAGYDLLVPTGNAVEALVKSGQLRKIDKDKLRNLKKYQAAVPGHLVRSRQRLLGALCVFADDHRLQRGKDARARPADGYLGGDFRAALPGKGERAGDRPSIRSASLFAAALKYLGHSANDGDEAHLKAAARPDPAREALLGRVQCRLLLQGTDRR